jgi:hypothetical protein
MTADDLEDRDLMFSRFRRLVTELLRGVIPRTVFQSWEIELLIDIGECELDPKRRIGVLRQYLRAVERQLESGPGPPMKLSEFLQLKSTRRPSTE